LWQVDLMRVDLVAIDLVRIDLNRDTESPINSDTWIEKKQCGGSNPNR